MDTMIVVTRLNGPRFAVNPDLLQRIESTPDTILTLIDGTKYIVAESMEQITELVVEYRARVVAATLAAAREQDEDQDADRVAAVTELRPGGRPLVPVPDAADAAGPVVAATLAAVEDGE
jgi:flagellar protein FlbD